MCIPVFAPALRIRSLLFSILYSVLLLLSFLRLEAGMVFASSPAYISQSNNGTSSELREYVPIIHLAPFGNYSKKRVKDSIFQYSTIALSGMAL